MDLHPSGGSGLQPSSLTRAAGASSPAPRRELCRSGGGRSLLVAHAKGGIVTLFVLRSTPSTFLERLLGLIRGPLVSSPLEDPELPARIRTGDHDAIQTVVQTYLGQILRAARGAGLNPEQAEEVTQGTFTTFIETAQRFEGRSHVRTWLFGILYRKIAEARRGLARDRQMDPIDEVFESRFDGNGGWLAPPRAADADLENREVRREIEDCLDAAPTRQRMAFLLREVEGFSTDEICKVLEVTRTNLGVMLHRIRNRLRECLEAKGV